MNVVIFKVVLLFVLADFAYETDGNLMPMIDFRYWRCVMKREWKCPDSEINFYLYTPEGKQEEIAYLRKISITCNPLNTEWTIAGSSPAGTISNIKLNYTQCSVSRERPYMQWVDVRRVDKLPHLGWKLSRKNVLIIHGFNGTYDKTPMSFLRDAYLSRKDYNVFMVDWAALTRFPCYLSALSNTKLAAQCTAQLYSYLTEAGALARKITCVGHSLGAHVCGMMSNHLTEKQYKIVGLDPARPLVSNHGSRLFRLGRDDAYVVQVIHTNAGFLGESGQIGHADFCVNGGKMQPGCKGHLMRIARCSHFMSSCYFAGSVSKRLRLVGVPCDTSCPKQGRWGLRADKRPLKLGDDVPDTARGMYCVRLNHQESCPFD